MSQTLNIVIDGKECACEKGEFLYDVAARNGIFIPALCRRNEIAEHRSSCRVCIVEVEIAGRSRVVASCSYPVQQECTVRTGSDKIKEERAVIMGLLHARAPKAESIAQMCTFMGGDSLEGLVTLGKSPCIMCGACVQACEELGASAIGLVGQGVNKKIAPPFDMAPKPCIGCANCALVCSTECIKFTEDEHVRSIWQRNFTLAKCENCGKVIGTVAMLAYRAHKNGTPVTFVCDECAAE